MRKQKRKRTPRPLTEQQKLAAKLLFEGHKEYVVADKVGVHRCTIWRWYKRRDFRDEIKKIQNQWMRELRRKRREEWRNSDQYKRQQAAKRRLAALEKAISAAGNSGNMAALARATNEYNQAFNMAFFGGRDPFRGVRTPRYLTQRRKTRKPLKYIFEIVN